MTLPPPDGSRDRRIEDPTNLWIVHPLSRALLRPTIRLGVSANAVSFCGLVLGAAAALAFARWSDSRFAALGLSLAVGWLVADGLDGMVARATGTASALGRFLDGLCDHGVFALIYVALAVAVGTPKGWALAVAAGAAHAVQSSLYEGERARFHRRAKGLASPLAVRPSSNPLVRGYDRLATLPDRLGERFDALLREPGAAELGRRYAERAVAPMRLEALLTANGRVVALFLACIAGDPRLFWLYEIGPLTLVAVVGLSWHRRIEAELVRHALPDTPVERAFIPKDHITR